MEIWKDVPGYVGLYQVSNYGNVKSILYNKRKTFSIHRLVAAAFIPKAEQQTMR